MGFSLMLELQDGFFLSVLEIWVLISKLDQFVNVCVCFIELLCFMI